MSNDIPFMLILGTLSIEGLLILHFASRKHSAEQEALDLVRGIAFLFAGLFLILPLLIWLSSFRHLHPNPQNPIKPGSIFLMVGYLDVAFFWFIWNLNSFAFRPQDAGNAWERNWGETYSADLKRHMLVPIFERLEREGKIGNLVVDVGSGASPVTKLLPRTQDRKFVFIDIAGANTRTANTQGIRWDARKIGNPDSLSYRKALLRVTEFLGQDPRDKSQEPPTTAIVFSDFLNYVDFREVIGGFARFLCEGGRVVIANRPNRGIKEEFCERGLKNNADLCAFLAERQLEIESKEFPYRDEGSSEEAEEMMVLVAKQGKMTKPE